MNDKQYMQLALNLASSVSGQTSPNPTVGSIVVKNGEILGFGAHLKAGEVHAEVHALNMARDKTENATIYVTLEPCSYHGKTPPCTDYIIKKGIKRAVIAVTDPNEKVAGSGIKKLRSAGIEVRLGVLKEEAKKINAIFFHYIQTKTPYVTMKSAVSLDGKIATYTRDSKWITGEDARLDVHHYRHTHDAILVGVDTVITDNPSLTTRLPNGGKNPLRIILDTNLRTPLNAIVLNDQQADTWILTGRDVTEQESIPYKDKNGVTVIQLEQMDIDDILGYLGSQGIMSLLVEAGATVNGSFLEKRRINQLVTYMGPKLIGGKTAPTSIGGNGFWSIADTLPMDIKHVGMIDKDIKIIAEPRKGETDVYRNN